MVNNVDVLVSWNFQHIMKLKTRHCVNGISKILGCKEIHEIREAIYEEQKNMSRDETLQSLHASYKRLMREKGLKVRLCVSTT